MPSAFKRVPGYPQFLVGQKNFQRAQELVALVAKEDSGSVRSDRMVDLQKHLLEARKLLTSAHNSCGEIFPAMGAMISYQLAVLALAQRDFAEVAERTRAAVSHVRFLAQLSEMARDFKISQAIEGGIEKGPKAIKATNPGSAQAGWALGLATVAVVTKLRILLAARRARPAWSLFSLFGTVVETLDKIRILGFWIPCRTAGSESVRVVGSCPELGAWNPWRGVLLDSRNGFCSVTLPLFFDIPKLQSLEYKYVVTLRNSIRWEGGSNHRAAPGNQHLILCRDQWHT
jgi:hypothetical protein